MVGRSQKGDWVGRAWKVEETLSISKWRECFKKEKRLIVLSATDEWRLKYSHWVKRQVIGGLVENRLVEWRLKANCRAPLQYRNSQPLSLTLISIGTWVLMVCWLPSSILNDSFPGWVLLTPTKREQPPKSSFQNILLLSHSQSPPNPCRVSCPHRHHSHGQPLLPIAASSGFCLCLPVFFLSLNLSFLSLSLTIISVLTPQPHCYVLCFSSFIDWNHLKLNITQLNSSPTSSLSTSQFLYSSASPFQNGRGSNFSLLFWSPYPICWEVPSTLPPQFCSHLSLPTIPHLPF